MIYQAYQTQTDLLAPVRALTGLANGGMRWLPWLADLPGPKRLAASYDLFDLSAITHTRPAFGIDEVTVGDRAVAVREEVVDSTPFGSLLHFAADLPPEEAAERPKVLLVAALSGHFATLLRPTVRTMLADHDVYITDWHNARDIPLSAGRFGFDEYVEHLMQFMRVLGPNSHLMAVCQPCVAAMAATALMSEDGDPATPRSLTLMAGPIDTRIKPTQVNEVAMRKPLGWFAKHAITTVPGRFAGAGREVYPGFMQLTAFMSMNPKRHTRAFMQYYKDRVKGNDTRSTSTKAFYEEYFAVLDMTAEFYLETVSRVFKEQLLAKGELEWNGRRVDPGAIRNTVLLTVEGEKDDMCAVGQTSAAHGLCVNLPDDMKHQHLQAGVGHYGVFAGSRWHNDIYPVVRDTIRSASAVPAVT